MQMLTLSTLGNVTALIKSTANYSNQTLQWGFPRILQMQWKKMQQSAHSIMQMTEEGEL